MAKRDEIQINIKTLLKDDASRGLKNIEESASKLTKSASTVAKSLKRISLPAKAITKSIKSVGKSLGSVTDKVFSLGGALAALGGAYVVGTTVAAAAKQEAAVNAVGVAMQRTGELTEGALEDMKEFASALQDVAGVGDETTLEMVALAKSFGATNKQAKEMAEAAVELSAATGKGLDESIRQISKTLGGFAGELGEVNPDIKALTQEQLKAGEAAKILIKQYSGSAAGKLNTFSGVIGSVSGRFGDFLETIGDLIIKNPLIIKLLSNTAQSFKKLGGFVSSNSASFTEFFNNAVRGFLNLTTVVLENSGIIITAIAAMASTVVSLVRAFTELGGVYLLLNTLKESVLLLGIGLLTIQNAARGVSSVIAWAKGDQEKLKELEKQVNKTRESMVELNDLRTQDVEVDSDGLVARLDAVQDSIDSTADGLKGLAARGAEAAKSLSKEFKGIGTDPIEPKLDLSALDKGKDKVQELGLSLKSAFESLESSMIDVGLTETEVAIQVAEQRLKLLDEVAKKAPQFAGREAAARIKVAKDLTAKLQAIEKKRATEAQKNEELNNKKAEQSAKQRIAFQATLLANAKKIRDVAVATFQAGKELFGSLLSFGNDLISGKFLTEISAFTKGLLSIPSKLNEELDSLAVAISPDSLREFSTSFVTFLKRLPGILEGTFKALPTIFKTLIAAIPSIAKSIVAAIPQLVGSIVDVFPELVQTIVNAIPGIVKAIGKALPVLIKVVGQAIQEIINSLPEILDSFLESLPAVLTSLLEALPGIITAIFDILPELIKSLVDAIPDIVEALANNIGPIVEALVEGLIVAMPRIVGGLVQSLLFEGGIERIVGALARGIIKAIIGAVDGFASGFQTAIADVGKAMAYAFSTNITMPTPKWVDDLKDFLAKFEIKLPGGDSNAGGATGVFTKLINPLGSFATGGQVPRGFQNDSFPARLTSGELVIPPGDTQRLSQFLDGQANGGGNQMEMLARILASVNQPMQISTTAEVNGESFADIILNLNRDNARLS